MSASHRIASHRSYLRVLQPELIVSAKETHAIIIFNKSLHIDKTLWQQIITFSLNVYASCNNNKWVKTELVLCLLAALSLSRCYPWKLHTNLCKTEKRFSIKKRAHSKLAHSATTSRLLCVKVVIVFCALLGLCVHINFFVYPKKNHHHHHHNNIKSE